MWLMITGTLEHGLTGNDPALKCRGPQRLHSLELFCSLTKNGQVLQESANTANHSPDRVNYRERVRYPVSQHPFYCSLNLT